VSQLPREESDAYFHSRPRASQLAAWASPQSAVIASRSVLEEAFKTLETKYAGQEVPMPAYWGGYRVQPVTIEFWQGRHGRLHDRLRYRRDPNGTWAVDRLAP
jgi:pyridoxamine 5'-phosphate oxidase